MKKLKNWLSTKRSSILDQYEPFSDSTEKVVVQNLELWGSQQAQKLKGSTEGLLNSLKLVERGYIVESGSDKEKQHTAKKHLRDQIDSNEKTIEGNNGRIISIKETVNPHLKKQIETKNEEIVSLEADKQKSVLSSNYSSITNYFLMALVITIGVYLLMFYASAVNAALFTNMGSKLQNVTVDNLDSIFVSIFDTEIFTSWTAKSIFIYIAAVLFIGIGFLPHTTESLVKKIAFYLLPLAVDVMLAYKIELNIYESKVMTGLAEPGAGLKEHIQSVNFWLVIALGYVAYIVWGQLWEAWNKENNKKDAGKMSFLQIQLLKKQIKEHETTIHQNNLEIGKLKNEISQLQKEIEKLTSDLNHIVFSRNDLQRKLSTFMDGWLKYVATDKTLVHLISNNEATYSSFINSINLN